jgi:hypothetical protein
MFSASLLFARSVRCVVVCLTLTGIARAQIAEVIRPDARGDFHSIQVSGPRGTYVQRFWLVVDRDPRGLLCRDDFGRAWIALKNGAVVTLAPYAPGRPNPLIRDSKPYVRVQVKPMDILQDLRQRERGQEAVCAVRANTAFLTPINHDSLKAVLVKP